MTTLDKLRRKIFGAPLDPLSPKTRQHIALVAFLAWVGLGADGLSSSCYGPEQAFKALGGHAHLGPYLALPAPVSGFVISPAYNQGLAMVPWGAVGQKG